VTPRSRSGGVPNELGFLYSRKAGAAASSVVPGVPTDPTCSRRAMMLAERACADNHSPSALVKRWYGRYGREWSPVWVMGLRRVVRASAEPNRTKGCQR
jgi:hypothetical protein